MSAAMMQNLPSLLQHPAMQQIMPMLQQMMTTQMGSGQQSPSSASASGPFVQPGGVNTMFYPYGQQSPSPLTLPGGGTPGGILNVGGQRFGV